jgi:hypothetical protein
MSGECGTYAGYQRHIREGSTTCELCRAAARIYARMHRAKNPSNRERDRRQVAAYNAAERRIRAAHSAEFQRYYAEELQRLRAAP